MEKGKKFAAGILSSILVFVSLPILSGCQTEEPSFLLGTVELTEPIVQATISVYDSKDKLLYKETDETSDAGVFVLKITKSLPNDFRIEATDGINTANNEPFDEVIVAEIRDYDEQIDTSLSLGPISTLVASYMEKHSEMPYEDVQAKILEFLNLEPDINIMRDMLTIQESIHPAIFEAEAVKAGGFDVFITLLVDHIDIEGGKYSDIVAAPFGTGPVTIGIGGAVAKSLLLGLAEGIGKQVGGEAAGWVIDQIRGGDGSDSTANAIDDMSEKLDQISAQITALNAQLTQGIIELKLEGKINSYEAAVRELQGPISDINTAVGYLRNITRLDPNIDDFDESLQYYVDKIDTSKIEAALLQIHNVLVGQPSVRGITGTFREIVLQESTKSWSKDKYPILESQFEYFASLQLVGLVVLIDKYHAEDAPAAVKKMNAEDAINNYQNRIQVQANVFLTSVESILAWHTQCFHNGDHPVYQKDWSYTWIFNRGLPIIGTPVESITLKKADKLVGDYLGLESSITIRVYNMNRGNFKGDLNGYFMGMYLASESKDGTIVTELVKPQIIETTYPSQGDGTCLQGGAEYTAQFAIYRFDNLGPGVYYIHDDTSDWRYITGWATAVPMINSELFNLAFNVTEGDPYHNQLIVGWLSEIYMDR